MLDEKTLRREGWTEGPKVKLRDGQEWTFPRPWMTLFPGRDEQGNIAIYNVDLYGVDHLEELDRFHELGEEDGFARTAIILTLASRLLLLNYDLTDRQLRSLLPMELRGDADNSAWEAVRGVVFGQSPKPGDVGSDAPSSPTGSEEISPSTTPTTSP